MSTGPTRKTPLNSPWPDELDESCDVTFTARAALPGLLAGLMKDFSDAHELLEYARRERIAPLLYYALRERGWRDQLPDLQMKILAWQGRKSAGVAF